MKRATCRMDVLQSNFDAIRGKPEIIHYFRPGHNEIAPFVVLAERRGSLQRSIGG